MKKIIVFCLISSLMLSCGSKKAVTKKKSATTTKTETVITKNDNKNHSNTEVVNGVPVQISSVSDYISLFKDIAQNEMRLYNIPASITLAQGILESNAGKGRLAVEANNHFGIKCHEWTGDKIYHDDDASQECFRKYSDSKYSYRDHSLFLANRKRYAALFKLKKGDYNGWAKELKNAGYATDRKYPDKLISLIERYDLHVYDTEVLGADAYVNYEEEIGDFTIYHVEKGDSMFGISKKYNISVDELKTMNNLSTTSLHVGQKLKIDRQSKTSIVEHAKASEKTIVEKRFHTVQKGETLYSISKQHDMTVPELQKLNGLINNALYIGQELQIKSAN